MARQQIRDDDVPLDLPFGGGRWLVRNSSGNRVPSYETKAFGSSHAIDFAHVDERGRSAPRLSRSLVRSEPPEVFDDFGPPNLSPTSSSVVVAHDGEPDHEARRPQPSPPYMLTQGRLVRSGPAAIAGSHVVVAISRPVHVLLAHLRRSRVQVGVGESVAGGQQLAECGNSGDSTARSRVTPRSSKRDRARVQPLPMAAGA